MSPDENDSVVNDISSRFADSCKSDLRQTLVTCARTAESGFHVGSIGKHEKSNEEGLYCQP